MKTYTAVVMQDTETGMYVGYIPGWDGAHSQADSLEELSRNLSEAVQMLKEDGEPVPASRFIGTLSISD